MNASKEIGRFGITVWTEWDFLWAKLNWVSFTFAHLEFENDRMFGNYELTVALLGFGLKMSWQYADTEFSARLRGEIEKFDK